MEQLVIVEKIGENYMLLDLSGPINSYTVTEFQGKVYTYIRDTNVVMDMSKVTAIDSTGLGVIMAGFNDGQDYGNNIYLLNPSDSAKHALETTGFFDLFKCIRTITEVE